MSACKLLLKIFRFRGLKVKSFSFENRGKELHINIKPHKNGSLCPVCKRRGKIIRRLNMRSWIDVTCFGIKVILWYDPVEIICPTHGRAQEDIPWAAPNAKVTYRMEYMILIYSQMMTQKAAAKLLNLPSSTFSDILHRTIKRIRKGHKIRGLKRIGIDEISYKKGKKYVTIVYDLETSRVIWVGKGKDRACIDRFFNEELSKHQKESIEFASCDMSQTYIGAIKEHCPNATLVLDRFHVVKSLNDAVDEVRKEAWREATKEEKRALKGLRWILYRRPENRSEEDKKTLKRLETLNKRILRACVYKDEFNKFWDCIRPGTAEKHLRNWINRVMRSRLEPLKKFARTMRLHFDRVRPFYDVFSCKEYH